MKQVKNLAELMRLVDEKRSVCYGKEMRRVPAAVFVNFNFFHVYKYMIEGRVFIYEPKKGKVSNENYYRRKAG